MFSTPRPGVRRRLAYTTPRRVFRRGAKASTFNAVQKRTTKAPSRRGTLTQQVKSLQRAVSALAPELKVVDITTNVTNLTTVGSIQHVTAIAQGSDTNNRVGNTITLKEMYLQTQFTIGQDTSQAVSWRIAIVQDTQQIADFSDSGTAIASILTSANPVICLPNIGTRERYKFLYMSPVMTGVQYLLGQRDPNVWWRWKGNLKVSYNGTASSDVQKNGIYIIYLTDSGSSTMDFVGQLRLMFTDD